MTTQELQQIINKVHEFIVFSCSTNTKAQFILWKLFKQKIGIKKPYFYKDVTRHKDMSVKYKRESREIKTKRAVVIDPFEKDILISVPLHMVERIKQEKFFREYKRFIFKSTDL